MVQGIFGLPGSGKSTYLAKIAKQYMKKGIKVYSNYYIKGCYQLDFDDLGVHDYSDCCILIDEISLFADSRNWKNYSPELRYFMATHRHANCDIYYASQSYKDCDIRIRNITDDIFYITSGLLGFSIVRKIEKGFSIDGEIGESYDLSGWPKLCLRRRYYNMFDSFERKWLPPNNAEPWPCSETHQNAREGASLFSHIIRPLKRLRGLISHLAK